ncbi:uncharacterized protein FIBRA_08437 [Fibroporia radiculosa]|uniref:Cytochrome P450 n=1 Tax=Fibroporia radiculosa TaxID=599839 RepID=J4H564_9APHY|nr:uncharacterized protein FIBRA_08437 [Fibroporia radiculosa]CCM06194.1 predicted protein [Fibroporia radiculosa]
MTTGYQRLCVDSIIPVSSTLVIALALRTVLQLNVVASGIAVVLIYPVAKHLFRSRKALSIAPGPTLWPIIGNVHQIPSEHPWLTYSKWAKTYGDIIHLDAVGQPIIVLNSANIARELLVKRSSIYSGRPHLVMAGDLAGMGQSLALQPYGEEWRRQRKLANQEYNQTAVLRYSHVQEAQARTFVQRFLKNPTSLQSELSLGMAAVILEANFGYVVKSEEDPFYKWALVTMEDFNQASRPGAFLVDFIPQLQYLPEWMPGTGFLQLAKTYRKNMEVATWEPFLWAKDNILKGTARMPSLCATTLLKEEPVSEADEASLVLTAAALFGGSLDTSTSSLLSFFLAMLHYPEVQAKGRAEIDAVIGSGRLPSVSDRASLPYVRSIITEIYRWAPAAPIGIPHALDQDDVYNGIHVPKGSLIIANIWHMLHDPEAYPEPKAFRPERFRGSDAEMQKVTDVAFGFGRRACPGMQMAQGTLFAFAATILATCEIVPMLDAYGKPVVPDIAYTSGVISFPQDVKCMLRPRSPQAKALLEQSLDSV